MGVHYSFQVPVYIGAQMLASICASLASEAIFDPSPIIGGGITVPSIRYDQSFPLEFIISFILIFVVTAVATEARAVGEYAGIAVGFTVVLNSLITRKVGAEFIGTLILIFAGTATAIVNQKTQGVETLIGLAASTGLAVMIVILSTGHISGAHLNPSITIAFAALKHFPWKHVPVYIGAQILASMSAAFGLKAIFDPIMGGGVTVPSVGYGEAFALEFIISFILMFVVTAVATDTRAVGELAGIAVGATVMLNILIAGNATGASMNPVRTLGPAVAANNYKAIWVYLTAPILGALSGAGTYTVVKLPKEDGDSPEKTSTTSNFRR